MNRIAFPMNAGDEAPTDAADDRLSGGGLGLAERQLRAVVGRFETWCPETGGAAWHPTAEIALNPYGRSAACYAQTRCCPLRKNLISASTHHHPRRLQNRKGNKSDYGRDRDKKRIADLPAEQDSQRDDADKRPIETSNAG